MRDLYQRMTHITKETGPPIPSADEELDEVVSCLTEAGDQEILATKYKLRVLNEVA